MKVPLMILGMLLLHGHAQEQGDYNYYERFLATSSLPSSVALACFPQFDDGSNSHGELFLLVDTHLKKGPFISPWIPREKFPISIRFYSRGVPMGVDHYYKNLHAGDHPTKFWAIFGREGAKGKDKSILTIDWELKTYTLENRAIDTGELHLSKHGYCKDVKK